MWKTEGHQVLKVSSNLSMPHVLLNIPGDKLILLAQSISMSHCFLSLLLPSSFPRCLIEKGSTCLEQIAFSARL